MKVTAKSAGTPSPALAGAFVHLLVAVVAKKPELKLVKVEKKERAA